MFVPVYDRWNSSLNIIQQMFMILLLLAQLNCVVCVSVLIKDHIHFLSCIDDLQRPILISSVSYGVCFYVYRSGYEKKTQLGNITISSVSWDGFNISWELKQGQLDAFGTTLCPDRSIAWPLLLGLLPGFLSLLYGLYRRNLLNCVYRGHDGHHFLLFVTAARSLILF